MTVNTPKPPDIDKMAKNTPNSITTDTPTPNPPVNKGIPIENLLDLVQKGLSCSQIATVVGCSKTNVVNRLKKYRTQLQGLKYYKANRADILALTGKKLIGTITDKDIQALDVQAKIKSAQVLHGMERLERGESTANIAHAQVNPADVEALKDFMSQWTQRQLEDSASRTE